MQDDIVLGDVEADLARQPIDGRLELVVVEGDHPATAIADEVVVMLAAWQHRFVASAALADLESPDELALGEELERSIHRRQPDAMAATP